MHSKQRRIYRRIAAILAIISLGGALFTTFTLAVAWRLAVIEFAPDINILGFAASCWFVCFGLSGLFLTLGWSMVRPGDLIPTMEEVQASMEPKNFP